MYKFNTTRKAPAANTVTFDGITEIGGWSVRLASATSEVITISHNSVVFHEIQTDANGVAEFYLSNPLLVPSGGGGSANRTITFASTTNMTSISLAFIGGASSITYSSHGLPNQ